VLPCNGTVCKVNMGSLKNQTWKELWNSKQCKDARKQIAKCQHNCWMIGSASPAMHKNILVPTLWILKHKLFKHNHYSIYENKFIAKDSK
jgi:hypothetical protein